MKAWTLIALLVMASAVPRAHSGPPYPIVVDQRCGPFLVSLWTDPDATDDGTPEGKLWIVVQMADGRSQVPADTQVAVRIHPLDRAGPHETARAAPVDGRISRQFVSLRMDHEGPFGVDVTIAGRSGSGRVESRVDATYDLRPPRELIALYVLPFVLAGGLWIKLLLRRRRSART